MKETFASPVHQEFYLCYHTGLRKGCDSLASSKYWSALYSACWSENEKIKAIFHEHVRRVAFAGADAYNKNKDRAEAREAMKVEAIKDNSKVTVYARQQILSGAKDMRDGDWDGVISFCLYCMGEED